MYDYFTLLKFLLSNFYNSVKKKGFKKYVVLRKKQYICAVIAIMNVWST